jgi:hypothetical protein
VHAFETGLVSVIVLVNLRTVGVFVSVLHMIVFVADMGVGVRHLAMGVLMSMGRVGHNDPFLGLVCRPLIGFVIGVVFTAVRNGISAAGPLKCSTWRRASSTRAATCESCNPYSMLRPSRRPTTRRRSRKIRNWCDTAGCSISNAAVSCPTVQGLLRK